MEEIAPIMAEIVTLASVSTKWLPFTAGLFMVTFVLIKPMSFLLSFRQVVLAHMIH